MVSYLVWNWVKDFLAYVLILIVVDDGLVHEYLDRIVFSNEVLILIVVDDGLVLLLSLRYKSFEDVLILIVVDDGLVLTAVLFLSSMVRSLNPYCSGRWSRTTVKGYESSNPES